MLLSGEGGFGVTAPWMEVFAAVVADAVVVSFGLGAGGVVKIMMLVVWVCLGVMILVKGVVMCWRCG